MASSTSTMTPTAQGRAACPVIRRGPVTVDYLRVHPTVSVEQAAQLLGISRAYAYQLTRTGELDVITLGERRVRVKSASLLRVLGEV
ncbi:helix-turn-helix domain-containing protein [Mycobacteroides abscessus]|uniref:helix-turn-helix domain-containing protein n=1 Tax=Mycobacteroides abscessus TaxID=36809 RepID=UPI001F22E2DA|nr:helix-turn-helix domain-containing protein [Mycobacteroides abscessus]